MSLLFRRVIPTLLPLRHFLLHSGIIPAQGNLIFATVIVKPARQSSAAADKGTQFLKLDTQISQAVPSCGTSAATVDNSFASLNVPLTPSYETSIAADKGTPFLKIETKIALGFTCRPCGHRVNRLISNVAYKRGLVLVRCPGCKNVHLIADHIGWFEGLAPGTRTIEEIVLAKGETVRRSLEEDEIFEVGEIEAKISN